MKESRISLLLLLSLSLLLLAAAVLFMWGFAFYKNSYADQKDNNSLNTKESLVAETKTRDSLQQIYSASISKLNTELDATRHGVDSIQANMDARLQEFSNLKNEINSIFQQNPSSIDNLAIARKRIEELSERLAEWRMKYTYLDEENKRLNGLLKQFSQQLKDADKPKNRNTTESKSLQLQSSASAMSISGLQFKAIMQRDDREQETNQAVQTDELKGSFDLKPAFAAASAADIFIVILQPDGKVMKRSAWDSGLFDTKEGRKVYSQKLSVDCAKAESKHLKFSIAADEYQKGSYIFQLYHNGKIIASTSKVLS